MKWSRGDAPKNEQQKSRLEKKVSSNCNWQTRDDIIVLMSHIGALEAINSNSRPGQRRRRSSRRLLMRGHMAGGARQRPPRRVSPDYIIINHR